MTTLRLALSELKRMTSGRLPRLAIIAMCLVPLLYGALYLYANWDPYAHLHNVKAAIVNLDAGSSRTARNCRSATTSPRNCSMTAPSAGPW